MIHIFSLYFSNSEAFASEFLENREEIWVKKLVEYLLNREIKMLLTISGRGIILKIDHTVFFSRPTYLYIYSIFLCISEASASELRENLFLSTIWTVIFSVGPSNGM